MLFVPKSLQFRLWAYSHALTCSEQAVFTDKHSDGRHSAEGLSVKPDHAWRPTQPVSLRVTSGTQCRNITKGQCVVHHLRTDDMLF